MGGHESGFSRLRAPVVFLRAVAEDNSLFNFSFDNEHDGAAYGACGMREVAEDQGTWGFRAAAAQATARAHGLRAPRLWHRHVI